jgi:hypothetical protein
LLASESNATNRPSALMDGSLRKWKVPLSSLPSAPVLLMLTRSVVLAGGRARIRR